MKLNPHLHDGTYYFAKTTVLLQGLVEQSVMFFREEEAITLIIPSHTNLPTYVTVFEKEFAWITLKTFTDLEGFGITAAFSQRLAKANISVNVVAGYNHDHLFIPYTMRNEAMEILEAIEL